MSRSTDRDSAPLVLGGVPRAQLMPVEVAQDKRESARRRGLVALVFVMVLIVGAAIATSFWYAAQAESALADERAVTEQLFAEQLTYTEVLEVRGRLNNIREQRQSVTEGEVLWREIALPYLEIVAVDGVVQSATLATATPGEAPLAPQDSLRTKPVATIVITVATPAVPEPHRWLRSFESVASYGDASFDSIALEEGSYVTTVTVNLSAQALSGRFANEEEN